MSQIRHTSGLDTVLRWMERTIQDNKLGGGAVDVSHVITWRDALLTIHLDLVTRERNLIIGEARQSDANAVDFLAEHYRLDMAYAENMFRLGMGATERLALQAMKHPEATTQDRRRMKMDAAIILDALEHLTLGVVRPEFNPETDTGA